MSQDLSIGQVAGRTGLSVHTLRFYENEGLLPDVRRDAGGRRVYGEDDLEWIAMCVNLRATGMPIPVIRRYVGFALDGDEGPALVELLQEHAVTVREQLDRHQAMLDLIAHKIAVYGGPDPVDESASVP